MYLIRGSRLSMTKRQPQSEEPPMTEPSDELADELRELMNLKAEGTLDSGVRPEDGSQAAAGLSEPAAAGQP